MASADALSSLLRDVPETVIGDNPYVAMAKAFAAQQQNVAPPRNNLESFLVPLIQNSTLGIMQGLAANKEKENLFDYYKNNPLIQALASNAPKAEAIGPVADGDAYAQLLAAAPLTAYQQETAPPSWTPEKGKGDLFQALIGYQAQQEQQKALNEVAQAVAKRQAMLPVFEQEQKIRGAINPSGTKVTIDSGLGQAAQDELRKSYSVIQEADALAGLLDSSKAGWLDYQIMKKFGAADKDGIALQVKNLADRLSRARTGAALNASEERLYTRLVGGDISVDPKQAAQLLRKLSEAESRIMNASLDFAEQLKSGGTPAIKANLAEQSAKRAAALQSANVPAGMRLVRNKLTGETKLVPQ